MLSKAQEAALQAIRDCADQIFESCDDSVRSVGEIIKDHFGIEAGESIPDGPLKEAVVEFVDILIEYKYSREAADLAKKYSI